MHQTKQIGDKIDKMIAKLFVSVEIFNDVLLFVIF